MRIRNFIAVLLAAALISSTPLFAQDTGNVWRTFAEKLDPGSTVLVRLQNGQRFQATLIEARSDALVLQPKTRRPVPVQPVSYDAIQSLDRHEGRGAGVAKAVAIGAAVGAGAFLGFLAILFTAVD